MADSFSSQPTDLDQRAKILLKTLVERYIAEGEPVGSRLLSQSSGLDLSAASIRHIMADLENMGLISSPHTSAGRIPTTKGYRFFVDRLLQTKPIEDLLTGDVSDLLHGKTPQQMLPVAAQLLSNLSQFAGVVMTNRKESALQHIEFLRLSAGRVLVVMVSPDGEVHNRLLLTKQDYPIGQLQEASQFINQHYAGMGLEQIRTRLSSEMNRIRLDLRELMEKMLNHEALILPEEPQMVVSGERHLWETQDFVNRVNTLKQLFDLLDEKKRLVQLLDESRGAQGVQIFIGGESSRLPLEELSVVTSSYLINGKIVGTLGVIGPTRMAYERVVPIVEITSKLLGEALSMSLGQQQESSD